MRVKLIRQKIHTSEYRKDEVFNTVEITEFTMSRDEYLNLSREIDDLNTIFAGGRMNLRYRLVNL